MTACFTQGKSPGTRGVDGRVATTAGLSWCEEEESCHSTGVQAPRIPVAIAAILSEIFPCVFFLSANCTDLAGKERAVKSLHTGTYGTEELLPSRTDSRNYKCRAGEPRIKSDTTTWLVEFQIRPQINGYSAHFF